MGEAPIGAMRSFSTTRCTVKIRHSFAFKHIQSAVIFSKKCWEIEQHASHERITSEEQTLYMAYVINSILSSVTFLEANINEFFCDVIDNPNEIKKTLDTTRMNRIRQMWELNVPRTASYPVVAKYQIALALTDSILFEGSEEIYQDIKTLTQLRNELIHYEPSWIESYDDSAQERKHMKGIGKKLQHKKFDRNPFTGAGNPFFPDKCLGYGCTKWAISTSLDFCKQFYQKIKLERHYELIEKCIQNIHTS
jgi:hypothetical protein